MAVFHRAEMHRGPALRVATYAEACRIVERALPRHYPGAAIAEEGLEDDDRFLVPVLHPRWGEPTLPGAYVMSVDKRDGRIDLASFPRFPSEDEVARMRRVGV